MAYERRSFAGGAVATTLAAGIDASTLTVTIAASTGWPSGSAGDYFAVIDRGTASEEKVRVDTRSGTTLTLIAGGRGVDGTTGAAHSLGATIELCVTAVDLDEANAHLADTALDHHTQYLTTGRHDIEGRHAFGAAYGTPAAAADIGTAASAGTGDNPAREDHVHQLGTGSIDTANQFAAGVIDAAAIGTSAVTTAKILDANVTTAKIADANVTTAKIADANVTTAKIADASITAAKFNGEAWASYTPAFTNLTLGNGTVVAKHRTEGKTCHVRFQLTWGTTTSCSASPDYPQLGLPAAAVAGATQIGSAVMTNSGTKAWPGTCGVAAGDNYVTLLHVPGGAGTGNIDATTPFTWGSTDVMRFSITYEIA